MFEEEVVYVTEEGLEKIKEELEHLKTVKRPEIAEQLRKAVAEGDISENANYDYAKQEQAFLEGRILDLEDSLRRAQVIEDGRSGNTVRVGSTVTIIEVAEGYEETYRIVGVHEAAPGDGFISNESPIGQALLGAKLGQTVTANLPYGEAQFKIKSIK